MDERCCHRIEHWQWHLAEIGKACGLFAATVGSVLGVVGSTKEERTVTNEAASPERNGLANGPSGEAPSLRVFGNHESPAEADGTPALSWNEEEPAAKNYRALGALLANSGDLYRLPEYGSGLLLVHPDSKQTRIRTGADLAPVIVDRVVVSVYQDGKPKGSRIVAQHLNTMLRSSAFLDEFKLVDRVTATPVYLPDFTLTEPGYHDGGPGHRILYTGGPTAVKKGLDRTTAFLDVMSFASEADRTNAVAAALTVLLRNHWPGGKPIVLATATKSHSGKDTMILFASGQSRQCSISYQATDWALERAFVGAIYQDPEIGVMVIENARLDRRDRRISSAFVERFATDPEPLLFSTGTGPPARRRNDIVIAISTNYGSVSEDILNRSLPIHLNPVGDVSERVSPIGNPKLEYLPAHRDEIAAELREMIERWKSAGRPLDKAVRHPFSLWAETVGGILAVNGFRGFLANYGVRKANDDPLRHGLGLLGAAKHGEAWYRPEVWALLAVELGLVKQVIPPSDQESGESRKRGVGVVLSNHRDETFTVETDSEVLTLSLERKRGRFGEKQPHFRYRFIVLDRQDLADDCPT